MSKRDYGLRAKVIAELEKSSGCASNEIAEESEGIKTDEEGRGRVFDDVFSSKGGEKVEKNIGGEGGANFGESGGFEGGGGAIFLVLSEVFAAIFND